VEERTPSSLPRPLRIAAVALAGLVLFAGFVYLGFPYDRLGAVLAHRIERATGVGLDIGGVAASPHWLGPGIAVSDVRARLDGRVQDVSRLHVRPAWSLSWLLARPALALDAVSPTGSLRGVLTLGPQASFTGELRELDLGALGLEQLASGLSVDGSADLVLSLSFGESGAEGPVSLVARQGTLEHPSLPLAIPYEEIQGEFVLGGENALRIDSLSIDSSLGQGAIDGSVGRARANGAPLDLQVEIAAAPAVQSVLRAQGIQLAANGTTRFHLAGTTTRPSVR
jgi:type II secretion system protein N